MNLFARMRNRFGRGADCPPPMPLRIEGIAPAPLTAEPDDAELAAAALLESMAGGSGKPQKADKPRKGTPDYYRQLSVKIREAHAAEARAAMRYVSYCEQELAKGETLKSGKGEKLAKLERGLFEKQDVVEREGGDLLKRWQHCLATVTVLQMRKYQIST